MKVDKKKEEEEEDVIMATVVMQLTAIEMVLKTLLLRR